MTWMFAPRDDQGNPRDITLAEATAFVAALVTASGGIPDEVMSVIQAQEPSLAALFVQHENGS